MGVQPSHKMRFTSDQGTYYACILYMRQQSSSPGHPSTADEALSKHVLHSWWFVEHSCTILSVISCGWDELNIKSTL